MPIHRNVAQKVLTFLFAIVLLSGCFSGPKKARILERADRYFKAGEYDKAKVEYLNVLRLDNQNLAAFQQLGFIWFEQGVPFRAAPFLIKVRELSPQNIAARLKLALVFEAVGQPVDARKEAVSILKEDPANSEAIVILADASQSKEEIADAAEQVEKFSPKNTASFHLAKASLAIRKGDQGTAADEVQQAIAAEPNLAKAHSARAYLYLLRQDPGHAGPELKVAADLAPLRSEERVKYAEFQAEHGAVDQAKTFLQSITKQAPDYTPAWRDLARIALIEKKYDESLSLLENIFSRNAEDPDARVQQAEVLLAKGDSQKALAILDRLNNAYPNNAAVKYQLARAYLLSKNPNQAIAALEQAVAAKPDYTEAILALADLNLQSGKPQAVVAAMEEFVKKHPDLPQARLLLANAYRALGRLDDAATLFREQIKATPESADDYFLLGQTLRQQKKDDEARRAFEKASELAPYNTNPVDRLVEMDLADKRYAAAIERVQQELQKNPASASAHVTEAKIYATQRDWPRATSALQKAIELDANFAPAYDLLIGVYLAENKLPQALSELEAGLTKNPNNPRALLTVGMIYEQMKDYEKARGSYEKLVAMSPDAVPGLNNLAVLYAEHFNQLDKAYELAQKAHSLQPGVGAIGDTLGWILYKRGDYQQALALLQESAGKVPDDPEIQFHLGMAAYMMGQAGVAHSALEKAVQSTVVFPGKKEAQDRLAQLQNYAAPGVSPNPDSKMASKGQPNDLMALLREGEADEKQGDAGKAAAAYEQAFKLNSKLPTTALKLAQLYAGPLHQPSKALEFAKKARELAPNDASTAGTVGRIAYQAGNFTWAYGLLQESARRNAADAGVLHDLAMTAYVLGNVPEARQTMERVLSAKPDAAQSEDGKRFLEMTALEQPSADTLAAQSKIESVLKAQPDYLPSLMAQAAVQLQHNDTKAAAGIYSDVLRKYPDFAPAQKRLAAIYAEDLGNLAKAYDLAMKARKTMPDDPELARTLAELGFKRNEFSYAVQLFKESGSKQPLPAKDLYYLGMAQLQSRQEAEGRKNLEQAISAGLPEALAQDAQKRLAEQPK